MCAKNALAVENRDSSKDNKRTKCLKLLSKNPPIEIKTIVRISVPGVDRGRGDV